jgi:divalent metal cation (Fe/Co/Zn/Cd) transporter
VDEALEANAAGRRALWISLAALGLTAGVQGVIVTFTGSVALLSDTLHNVADALTAVPLLFACWLGDRRTTGTPTGTAARRTSRVSSLSP